MILDDFFFYTSKSDADIAARGARSWTQYRLDRMRQVSQQLVLGPARAVNPHVRVIIKYPNWYEHFQGLGYDLDRQPRMFDGIYTGTETRDPEITDQLLQQYESYEILRYFDNIAPGRNGGGWVDTYSTRSVDRYAEQLWDTLFARAPRDHAVQLDGDGRSRAGARRRAHRLGRAPHQLRLGYDPPRLAWRSAAGLGPRRRRRARQRRCSARRARPPVGLASYKPVQSSGEDFLHNYLGNLGIPIELSPTFPANAETVLLTEAAAADPQIIARIRERLQAGGRVIITSGFLAATQDRFQELAEWRLTGRRVLVDQYYDGFGAGNGANLDPAGEAPHPILVPEVHFFTNDSWPIIRGVASAHGFPMMLMNRYSRGTLLLWTIPENIGDLYNLPQPMVTRIKAYLMPAAPVRIDAPSRVALFTYDNGAFIVENYRGEEAEVTISLAGTPASLRETTTGATLQPIAEPPRCQPPRPAGAGAAQLPHHDPAAFLPGFRVN